jgi:hypothetical protein
MAEEFKCYAPVFKGHHPIICAILRTFYLAAITALIVGTLGLIFLSAKGRCLIRQYLFRISFCVKGNGDPNLPI